MPIIPKLNLSYVKNEDSLEKKFNRPADFMSRGDGSSGSSSSGRSWGTDSTLYKDTKQYVSRPPYAVYVDNSSGVKLSSARQSAIIEQCDENEALETARGVSSNLFKRGDETDRYCTQMEHDWAKSALAGEKNHLLTNPFGNANDSLSMRSSRLSELTSVRNIPGLSLTSRANPRRLAMDYDAKPSQSDLRVSFSARILLAEEAESTPSWSMNPLMGFIFTYDNSWALYDSHKTTHKRTKSFPLLNRGVYNCAWGERKGQPYYIADMFPGSQLYVRMTDLSHLPVSLRNALASSNNILRLRITCVNTSERELALDMEMQRQKVPDELKYSVLARLHIVRLPVKPVILFPLLVLQKAAREILRSRSNPMESYLNWLAFYRHRLMELMRAQDPLAVPMLTEEDLVTGASQMHFNFDPITYQQVIWPAWHAIAGREGPPTGEEFVHLLVGEILEYQQEFVTRAFTKVSNQGEGCIVMTMIERFYSLNRDLQREFGPCLAPSKVELMNLFACHCSSSGSDKKLSFRTFSHYYEALSIALGNCPLDTGNLQDPDSLDSWHPSVVDLSEKAAEKDPFVRIIKSTWGLNHV